MSPRPVRAVAALVGAGPLLLAFAGDEGRASAASAPEIHTVEIRAMGFHPTELRVRPGDSVVWINRDVVPHTATASDSAWTSPPLDRGERWGMLASAGDGHYTCVFHPVMEARLMIDSPPSVEEMP